MTHLSFLFDCFSFKEILQAENFWSLGVVMDQFYEIFDSYAEQLAKLPMLPVLQCVHYIIMNLKLRMGEGNIIDEFAVFLITATINVLELLSNRDENFQLD